MKRKGSPQSTSTLFKCPRCKEEGEYGMHAGEPGRPICKDCTREWVLLIRENQDRIRQFWGSSKVVEDETPL